MGFRFYRRLKIAPGLSVNLSRSGPSLSVGMRGAHVTVGKRGITRTIGLPGSGLFWTSRTGLHSGYHSASLPMTSPAEQGAADRHVELVIVVLVLLVFAVFFGWWLAQ
jgi:hypothetical protein